MRAKTTRTIEYHFARTLARSLARRSLLADASSYELQYPIESLESPPQHAAFILPPLRPNFQLRRVQSSCCCLLSPQAGLTRERLRCRHFEQQKLSFFSHHVAKPW